MALPSASSNVRPIAMTSPTAFMRVDSIVVGALELLEREARNLHHAVVDGRLEACRRGLRDIVDDLIKRVSDGKAAPRPWR